MLLLPIYIPVYPLDPLLVLFQSSKRWKSWHETGRSVGLWSWACALVNLHLTTTLRLNTDFMSKKYMENNFIERKCFHWQLEFEQRWAWGSTQMLNCWRSAMIKRSQSVQSSVCRHAMVDKDSTIEAITVWTFRSCFTRGLKAQNNE